MYDSLLFKTAADSRLYIHDALLFTDGSWDSPHSPKSVDSFRFRNRLRRRQTQTHTQNTTLTVPAIASTVDMLSGPLDTLCVFTETLVIVFKRGLGISVYADVYAAV